jgi:hypothetical protein
VKLILILLLGIAGCSNVMVVTGELTTEHGVLIIKAKKPEVENGKPNTDNR